jgi:hypothetical protein
MTQPTNTSDDNKARAFFAACLAIGGGFAGLVVAGLVLGADYMLHGEPHERERLAQQRQQRNRDRFGDALAWLENDRLERERHRQATRDWFAADPNTRGDKPSGEESFGRVMGRAWNNLLAGTDRFKRGWQKGRADAQQRRDNGNSRWWLRPGGTERPDEPEPSIPQEPQVPLTTPDPTAEPATQQPTNAGPDIVDAEIIPGPEPSTHVMVPVGEDEPRRDDESLAEYQRRLDDLEGEVQQNQNGHRPDSSQTALR